MWAYLIALVLIVLQLVLPAVVIDGPVFFVIVNNMFFGWLIGAPRGPKGGHYLGIAAVLVIAEIIAYLLHQGVL